MLRVWNSSLRRLGVNFSLETWGLEGSAMACLEAEGTVSRESWMSSQGERHL